MKRFICFLTAFAVLVSGARADEGMWMLPLLQKMNSKMLSEAGCRLTPEQIYSINHSSLKDAIVQFGGGCTGELISDEGLLVTNHHCGYASIQKLSSMEHDYLTDGYWAMNRSEELPVEGLTVTFLEYMQDVTAEYNSAKKKAEKMYRDSTDREGWIQAYLNEHIYGKLVDKVAKDYPGCMTDLVAFYNENVHYIIVTKTYTDIRFVGAPPSSIGKFGADTDNWIWPRHTGDFSMFRIYADKDNNPAPYSEDNVPYRPKQSLRISLKDINEGDYTMIMGYPGSTVRFQTVPELKNMLAQNDIKIAARTIRQDLMLEDMLADPAVKIQYANKYASSSNGWKKWKGMKVAFGKLNIIGRAEQEEDAYMGWIRSSKKRTAEYGYALDSIRSAVSRLSGPYSVYTTVSESVGRVELATFAMRCNARLTDTTEAAIDDAVGFISGYYKDYSASTDRKITKTLLKFYRDNVSPEYYLEGLGGDFATMDIDAYVDSLFDNSIFTSLDKVKAETAARGASAISEDPAIALGTACFEIVTESYGAMNEAMQSLNKARTAYTAGLLEWKKGEPSYPDANFTMRLTYGSVKSYSPADAVLYRYYTTLDGVMEKEDPDNWEFVVPERLKELWKNGDFGDYAMSDGKMPVAFLTNNDITGGNSGSPVLNADGELIGLAFDGNWESMSSDVMFEPELQRCICVDIRYVLFIMDKFGGAGYLLDEMNIVR